MATNTYVALTSTTVGTATPSVTLTGFSTAYKHLVLAVKCKSTRTSLDSIYVSFNGDSSTNYSEALIQANGTVPSKGSTPNLTRIYAGNAPGTDNSTAFNMSEIRIYDYRSTTTFKNVTTISGSANQGASETVDIINGMWRKATPEAITSVTVTMGNANIQAGSQFILYGLAAEDSLAKATGGAIYSDSTYFYHVFAQSGAFVPTTSLTCDVLVVAGGGGGGGWTGGGGGAGGLSVQTGRTVSSSATVTVGGGGAGGSNALGTSGSNSVFDTITSNGGGGGAWWSSNSGLTGGSGGGACLSASGGSTNQGNTGGATGYGFAGGNSSGGTSPSAVGAGGGGAGAVGSNSTSSNSTGGAGGVGRTDSLIQAIGNATGAGQRVSSTYYFAGGGGGSGDSGNAAGGFGGGGYGGFGGSGQAQAGTIATGGGGGGFREISSSGSGKSGGSGIVVVRYLKA